LSDQFTLYSLYAASIIFITLLLSLIIRLLLRSDEEVEQGLGVFASILKAMPYMLNLFVVLAVVSIPEGLPLTVGVSLAFSVMKMF